MSALANVPEYAIIEVRIPAKKQEAENRTAGREENNSEKKKMANRILIADDNQMNVELLETFLLELDCEIEMAYDGAETLEKVQSFHPDLLLLDIMMPKLNGFEVCKKLKSDPATSQTMVLMVTALNELGDIERAVEAGCDDFLSKPVNRVELLKRVENMLRLHSVTDELERLRTYIDSMEALQGPGRNLQE